MPKTSPAPSTLRDAIRYFADPDVALTFLASLRWPNGVTCPACEAKNPGFLKTRRIWKCRDCGRQFSVKLGTVFEDSPIGLDKWLPALWMLANSKNGISSYELARALDVTQKTGWFMLHRIRLAMQTRTWAKMRGHIEADESFIGGKAKFMHWSKRNRVIRGTGGMDKTPVLGLLERGKDGKPSRVRATVAKNLSQRAVRGHVVARTRLGFPSLPRSKSPSTGVLSIPPVPRMTRLRLDQCMNLALPPMKVSSASTAPRIFAQVRVCMASRMRWSMNQAVFWVTSSA